MKTQENKTTTHRDAADADAKKFTELAASHDEMEIVNFSGDEMEWFQVVMSSQQNAHDTEGAVEDVNEGTDEENAAFWAAALGTLEMQIDCEVTFLN